MKKRKATSVQEVVAAAIPGADAELADFVLWARTCYPCGPVSAKELYRAAHRWQRALYRGRRLCDWCDRIVESDELLCARCARSFEIAREHRTPIFHEEASHAHARP